MKKILIVGDAGRHMHRWLSNVASVLPDNLKFVFFCCSQIATEFDGVERVFYGAKIPFSSLLKKIPKIRGFVSLLEYKIGLRHVLSEDKYIGIIIHQPSTWQLPIVKFAKKFNLRVILTPWGSDVLRIPHSSDVKMSKMFELADFFTSNIPSFANQYISRYHIKKEKMIFAGFGSEVYDIVDNMRGVYSKPELASFLSIPFANYYVACGYTAQRAQNHLLMVNALGKNRDILPPETLLLFQFTYGNNKDYSYINEIKQACEGYGLRYFFLTDYLSNEKIAKYRLLADLFIHIQPTDAANASLQEYLLAGSDCINGSWLKYPQLEEYGLPYYICPKLEDLSEVIRNVLLKKEKRVLVKQELRNHILEGSWKIQKKYWIDFLKNI